MEQLSGAWTLTPGARIVAGAGAQPEAEKICRMALFMGAPSPS